MRAIRLTAIAFVLAAASVTCAAAAAGGPSPGVDSGTHGIRDGSVRYLTLPMGQKTLVQAVQVRGGRVARFSSIPGSYGIPFIAFDGSTGGLSWDHTTLVVASTRSGPDYSRFAVLDTLTLKARQTVTLKGTFSFDALSPDARTLYLIQHVLTRNSNSSRYYVRAYDLAAGRLLKKIIFDTREKWGLMSGSPVTRTTSRTGRWVYTLYTRPGGRPFVHALDAAARRAVCIDLPWHGSQARIFSMRLKLAGRKLIVHSRGSRSPTAAIDTRTFQVRT
jgi:hypothetical protein